MVSVPKTTLRQQKDLVESIQKVPLVQGIKLLREWLGDYGYEGSGECKHYAIVRTTGKCMNCAAFVQTPMPYDSDEAIGALRDRLRGD